MRWDLANKSFTTILKELSNQRAKDLKILRKLINENCPDEVEESLEGDQLIFTLPLRFYPDSYTKKPLLYATLTNRKSYISLNLICIHNDKKYREKFASKLLNTGVCLGASGCCYKIKTVNPDLKNLLEREISKMNLNKFVKTFDKYRQK